MDSGGNKDNYSDSNGRGHKQQSTKGPTLSCAQRQQGRHARDVPRGGGGGGNEGMGGGEHDGNGRGGGDGGSRRGGRWAGRAMLCSLFFFSPIIFLTVTATDTEGRGDNAATVVSSADPFS